MGCVHPERARSDTLETVSHARSFNCHADSVQEVARTRRGGLLHGHDRSSGNCPQRLLPLLEADDDPIEFLSDATRFQPEGRYNPESLLLPGYLRRPSLTNPSCPASKDNNR